MTKVKENVKEDAVSKNGTVPTPETKISLGELYGLSRSVFELSGSVPSMKGKIVYALSKNEAIFERLLTKADKARSEMLKEFVKMKDGQFVYTEHTDEEKAKGAQPEFVYKSAKAKDKAAERMQEMMSEKVDADFHKINMSEFDNLDIVPQRNPNIGLFMKYLISETPILRMN